MKKIFCLLTIYLGSFSISLAQNVFVNNETPKLSVSNLKWERRTEFPPEYKLHPLFDGSNSNGRLPTPSDPIPPGGLRNYYVYQALFTNDGAKKIKGIVWDYVLFDPNNNEEIGRHRIISYAKIGINKHVTLAGRDISPPSRIVTAKSLEIDKRSPYIERIEIKCVQYVDDSMWSDSKLKENECNFLRYVVKRKMNPPLFL